MMIHLNEDLTKLGLSLLLGAAVGIEREFNEKPAGLKTNVLICLGSTLFTLMSNYAQQSDTLRDFHIAAQIVTGIGFLGAGAIMREGDRVTGLTTAAVIWVVAAIGMVVAMGHYTLAAAGTAATLGIQIGLGQMDYVVDNYRQKHTFKIVSRPDDQTIQAIGEIFKAHKVRIVESKVMRKNDLYHSEWRTAASSTRQNLAAHDLLHSGQVIEVVY